MKVVLVGSGGRESALAWRLAQSPGVSELIVTSESPGWPAGTRVEAGADPAELGADLVVVGPEGPLAEGIADRLGAAGIPCFGPTREAARLEFSKTFTKAVAASVGIPTARHVVMRADDPASVAAARRRCDLGNVVVKVDGLAAGKGVFVCETPSEAHHALDEVLGDRFGAAASSVLLEERMRGPEVSVFALSDGNRAVGLPSSQDHKRLLDGDKGPNTGGMGAIAPAALLDEAGVDRVVAMIHQPVVDALRKQGTPFRGVLYAGLMLTHDGPRLLEFNVRFGDPECQPLMALWEDDPLPWMYGAATGALPPGRPRFGAGAACCVVLASAGYPESSTKGTPIPEPQVDALVFHAATRRGQDGVLRTNGGRVLGLCGVGSTLLSARMKAYAAVEAWRFEGALVRADIGGAPF